MKRLLLLALSLPLLAQTGFYGFATLGTAVTGSDGFAGGAGVGKSVSATSDAFAVVGIQHTQSVALVGMKQSLSPFTLGKVKLTPFVLTAFGATVGVAIKNAGALQGLPSGSVASLSTNTAFTQNYGGGVTFPWGKTWTVGVGAKAAKVSGASVYPEPFLWIGRSF